MNLDKVNALIAKLRAEVVIKRTKDGKITVEGTRQRTLREQRERGSSDPALRAMMSASNATARHFGLHRDPYENFREVAHTPLLQRQVCRCCSAVQINVAAELLHLRGFVAPDTPIADVWIRRSTLLTLPIEEPLWAPTQSVAHCARCVDEIHNLQRPLVDNESTGQLNLLH